MPTYRVVLKRTVNEFHIVEADDEESAVEIANLVTPISMDYDEEFRTIEVEEVD